MTKSPGIESDALQPKKEVTFVRYEYRTVALVTDPVAQTLNAWALEDGRWVEESIDAFYEGGIIQGATASDYPPLPS